MILLEPNLDGLVIFIVMIMLAPPVILLIIGLLLRKYNYPVAGKVFMILSGIYLITGLGTCGALMMGF
ncbi:hypothetical protein ACFSTE_15155 [Aquimarina hainanensis]|uniref:DUF3096 domain-containing protein n=1 Tax=Aquimarina hainanensis TaxID=1578017 RepID=A0ABW5NB16_9FLAO